MAVSDDSVILYTNLDDILLLDMLKCFLCNIKIKEKILTYRAT